MNIVLVTNKSPHHKYWVYSLYQNHNVVGIFHPMSKSLQHQKKTSKEFLLRYGWGWLIMKSLSKIYNNVSRYSMEASISREERNFFGDYDQKYEEVSANIRHDVITVNDPQVIQKIKNLNTDVICFLGGDIAGGEIIRAAKIASLNYHSGLSPFYNGAGTIFHAVSDFRPNFCGGTLMYITERIDGGAILSHYLTPIEVGDNAASLFQKGIIGAVKVYNQILTELENGNRPKGVIQQRSLHYLSGWDWTIANDIRLRWFEKSGKMKLYTRKEMIVNYYDSDDCKDDYIASKTLKVILSK